MKRSFHFARAAGGVLAGLIVLTAAGAFATDFSLAPREPGPGHRTLSYWWRFNKGAWELTPPEGFTLKGGGELRLEENGVVGAAAVCRQTTDAERKLLADGDPKAQADYVRGILPAGITELKLVGQAKNPLPVNGLTNFVVTYSYVLGGVPYQFSCMVSQGGEPSEQSPPMPGHTPPPTPPAQRGSDGKIVRTGEFFTTIVAAASSLQGAVYGAFQQLLGTARVKAGDPEADDSSQYVSHGMLGR